MALLSQYLFFLTRRPISTSNRHYLESRLSGLKTLAPLLREPGIPVLEQVAARLEALHPAAFQRLGPSVQLALLPLATANRSLPRDVVVADGSPPAGWCDGISRALLVLGPGIGIGDELIFSPLPRWLKTANPRLELATLSGYRGIWDQVAAVDRRYVYRDHRTLLAALRGEAPYDGYELVILGDFEHPALYPGVATDGRLGRYLEISLGSRSAFYVDNLRRWVYRVHHVTPYCESYYHGFGQVLRTLGLLPSDQDRFSGAVVARDTAPPSDRFQIFVSPFTSKYEPSEPYWSHLLASLVPASPPRPVRFVLDTGKNSRTEAFAAGLERSVRARVPRGVEVDLAPADRGRNLSLMGVFRQLESCQIVLCADSFAAHAAPLYDCTTLVIARAGLEPWRVPHPRSFYFDAEEPVQSIAAAMRRLLSDLFLPPSTTARLARFSRAETRLAEITSELQDVLAADPERDFERLATLYRELVPLVEAVTEAADRSPAEYRTLFKDPFFDAPLRSLAPEDAAGDLRPALLLHLRDQIERWSHTNYCKYLLAALAAPEPPEEDLRRQLTPADAADSGPDAPPDTDRQTAGILSQAVDALMREQLPTGEIATHFRALDATGMEYRQSPLLSTYVHDALGCFDVASPWVEPEVFDLLPARIRGPLVRKAAHLRRRIRQFLAWAEGSDGSWSFRGRVGGLGPDLDTTACAAAALLQVPRRSFDPPGRRHLEAIERLRAAGAEMDSVTAVNVLRFLALAGADVAAVGALRERVLDELDEHGLEHRSERYREPLAYAYCLARAWRHGQLGSLEEMRARLVPEILDLRDKNGGFGGSLRGTLALGALRDLGYRGPELAGARSALLSAALPKGGWSYEPFFANGGGAPAYTTALAMAAVARVRGLDVQEAA